MPVDETGNEESGKEPEPPLKLPHSAFELERLVFEEFLEAIDARLAAVARLLEAAERGVHVEGAAVDVDLSGADAARHALRARLVLRPDRAGEAVHRVIGDAH